MGQPLTVIPGTQIRLAEFDARAVDGNIEKESAEKETQKHIAALDDLAYRLYAENQRSLLVVLQGMDSSGKDGTIRAVLKEIDPQSCQVTSFKPPNREELAHDFLWRIHREVPRRGSIGIFNRSHYEDVLIVRVHSLVPEADLQRRYDEINAFEEFLDAGGTRIVKVFLHISKDEQRMRLQARLDNPKKRWKFNHDDLVERKLWDEYQHAYEEALTRCNTDYAPWHIVPADRKWYRNLLVSRIVHQALEDMNPQFPPPDPSLDGLRVE